MMKSNKNLNYNELSDFCEKLRSAFRHLYGDYLKATHFSKLDLKIGDWAIEQSYLGTMPFEAILKITEFDDNGNYKGVDIWEVEREWHNARFYPLPEDCQKSLNGEFRF